MIKKYVKSCFSELTKVTWPTKNQAVKLTIIVLIFCIIIALFLGVIDYLFNEGYNYLLRISASNRPPAAELDISDIDISGLDITTGDGTELDITSEPVSTIEIVGDEAAETDTTTNP